MKIGKAMWAAVLAVAMVGGNAAPAFAANCWQQQEVAAAMVRDLQTRMMVAGLKCRGGGPDMLAAYNRFVRTHRGTIQKHNDILRARFIRMKGAKAGERAYDSYTTALANNYGATAADNNACEDMEKLAKRAASERAANLAAVAEDYGLKPDMDGGACKVRMASRK